MKPCQLCGIGTAVWGISELQICESCARKFQHSVLCVCLTCLSHGWLPKSPRVLKFLVKKHGMTEDEAVFGVNVVKYACCANCNPKCQNLRRKDG